MEPRHLMVSACRVCPLVGHDDAGDGMAEHDGGAAFVPGESATPPALPATQATALARTDASSLALALVFARHWSRLHPEARRAVALRGRWGWTERAVAMTCR